MNEYWIKLKAWYGSLNEREQLTVRIGGVLVGIFIIYAGVWLPLAKQANDLRSKIISEQKTLVWMQNADQQIQQYAGQTKSSQQKITPVALLSILQLAINQAGLDRNLTSLKQASNDTIEIHFQKVPFDKLMTLFITLMQHHPITLSQLSTLSDNTPGLVNADAVLTLGK